MTDTQFMERWSQIVQEAKMNPDKWSVGAQVERIHSQKYPDGCPLMCEACTERLKWRRLTYGSFNHETIKHAVADAGWQRLRTFMVGMSLDEKYLTLREWVGQAKDEAELLMCKVQVTNYVNALRRGGLIK